MPTKTRKPIKAHKLQFKPIKQPFAVIEWRKFTSVAYYYTWYSYYWMGDKDASTRKNPLRSFYGKEAFVSWILPCLMGIF